MIVQEPSVFYAQSRILNALPPSVRDCKSLSSAALGRNPRLTAFSLLLQSPGDEATNATRFLQEVGVI